MADVAPPVGTVAGANVLAVADFGAVVADCARLMPVAESAKARSAAGAKLLRAIRAIISCLRFVFMLSLLLDFADR